MLCLFPFVFRRGAGRDGAPLRLWTVSRLSAPQSGCMRRPSSLALALFLALALTLAFPPRLQAAEPQAGLPPEVLAALKSAGIAPASVGVVAQRVDGAQPPIRHNASQAMNPASVMKLVTTYAALELLGPSYVWQTEALEDAAGNLYLRGSGDPRLALEQFWLLLRQLRARGVVDIAGDLVLDRSAFAVPPHDPAAFDGEPLRPYNVGPDAL